MTDIVSMDKLRETQQEQKAQMPQLDDGLTDNLPPPQQLEIQEQTNSQQTIGTASAACSSDYYTKDEFYEVFKSVFQYAGDITGTESLPIKEKEEISAHAASNRIYSMAEKYAFLRFLIDKRSSVFGETMLAAQFVIVKTSAVYEEKKHRKLGGDLWAKLFKRKGKAKDTASLAQAAAEKQQKQEN